MKKKILTSIMSIALAAVTIAGGTYAYLSDTETSANNTLSAKTFDLKIAGGGQPWSDGITTAIWTITNMKPGDTTGYGHVGLRNYGSEKADHAEINCSYTIDDPPGPESDTDGTLPDDMAGKMRITFMEFDYGGGTPIDCTALIDDLNGNNNGFPDLYDLKTMGGLDDLSLPPNGNQNAGFDMQLQFDTSAGNEFQGDTLNLTMDFTYNQDASQ